jgi:hypothetical protein
VKGQINIHGTVSSGFGSIRPEDAGKGVFVLTDGELAGPVVLGVFEVTVNVQEARLPARSSSHLSQECDERGISYRSRLSLTPAGGAGSKSRAA